MKKSLIILSIVLMLSGAAYADTFGSVHKTGEITVRSTIDGSSLKVGANDITIEIIGAGGEPVTDAEVGIYYFMPSMPAMNYETGAGLKGTKYVAVIKPTMPGEWDADIKVMKGAGEVQKVTISFDAK